MLIKIVLTKVLYFVITNYSATQRNYLQMIIQKYFNPWSFTAKLYAQITYVGARRFWTTADL